MPTGEIEKNDAFYLPLINQSFGLLGYPSFVSLSECVCVLLLVVKSFPFSAATMRDSDTTLLLLQRPVFCWFSPCEDEPKGSKGCCLVRSGPFPSLSCTDNRIAIEWPSEPIDHRVIDTCAHTTHVFVLFFFFGLLEAKRGKCAFVTWRRTLP